MVSASDFDNTRERLPYLNENQGEYLLQINKTERAETDNGEFFFVEATVLESSGDSAVKPGDDLKHAIRLDVSKKATGRMVERVRNFIYCSTGAKKLSGGDTLALLDDSTAFEGKRIRAQVEAEKGDDGELSMRDDGTPWISVRFASAT